KSFRYAELPLDPLTVLIGTNASGKSNVVEALEFLQRIANGENIETALVGDKKLPSIRGGVEWAARKGENGFILKVLVGVETENKQTDFLYSLCMQTLPILKIEDESINLKYLQDNNEYIVSDGLKLLDYNFPNLNYSSFKQTTNNFYNKESIEEYRKKILDLKIILDKQLSIGSFDLDKDKMLDLLSMMKNDLKIPVHTTLKNIFVINPIPSTMRDYSRLSENLESDGSNIAGVLAALPDDKKAEVENTLSEYIKYLPEGDIKKVWAEPVGRLKTDAMLYCQEEWKPGEITEIDARSMSDGTLRFLAILTALLTRPEGSQIVIEEIDNGLHPSRAALLVKILKEIGTKRNIDILLTTHNPALLDAFGPEIVPFVVVAHRDSETGESKLTLLEDIENLPLLLASGTLGRLATKGAIEKSLSNQKSSRL
ncbi:MAG: ATP-binding protein, partial [Nostocales cyanobacterium]